MVISGQKLIKRIPQKKTTFSLFESARFIGLNCCRHFCGSCVLNVPSSKVSWSGSWATIAFVHNNRSQSSSAIFKTADFVSICTSKYLFRSSYVLFTTWNSSDANMLFGIRAFPVAAVKYCCWGRRYVTLVNEKWRNFRIYLTWFEYALGICIWSNDLDLNPLCLENTRLNC